MNIIIIFFHNSPLFPYQENLNNYITHDHHTPFLEEKRYPLHKFNQQWQRVLISEECWITTISIVSQPGEWVRFNLIHGLFISMCHTMKHATRSQKINRSGCRSAPKGKHSRSTPWAEEKVDGWEVRAWAWHWVEGDEKDSRGEQRSSSSTARGPAAAVCAIRFDSPNELCTLDAVAMYLQSSNRECGWGHSSRQAPHNGEVKTLLNLLLSEFFFSFFSHCSSYLLRKGVV